MGVSFISCMTGEVSNNESTVSAESPDSPNSTEQASFSETFDGPLKEGWEWLGGASGNWSVGGGKLSVRTSAAGIFRDDRRDRHVLLRELPRTSDSACVQVDVTSRPTALYENAGLIIYATDDDYAVLTKEAFPGQRQPPLILRAFSEIDQDIVDDQESTYSQSEEVQLRMEIATDEAVASFREMSSSDWQTLGTVSLPSAEQLLVGVQSGYGGEEASDWAEFDNFEIRSPCW